MVKWLIGINAAVFLLQAAAPGYFEMNFALWPLQEVDGVMFFRPWQLITYAFLHGNFTHILFNMWGLWMFGSEIERYLGTRRLGTLYFASVLSAAASQLFVPLLFNAEPAPTVGASGGVFGLLLAYAVMFPQRKIVLLIPPIPMPAWLFAALYAGLELFLGLTGAQSNVAHFAHLGGMIGSGLLLLVYRGRRYTGSL